MRISKTKASMSQQKSEAAKNPSAFSLFTNFFNHVFSDRKWLACLAAVNFTGFVYGLYFYQPQLAATSPRLWLFVIDSPLPVLAVSLLCLQKLVKNRMNKYLAAFAVFGLIKYGFWTVLVLGLYSQYFYAASPLIYSMNIPLHAAMILEGVALFCVIKPRVIHALIPLAFYLANDFLDYFAGTVTRIPYPEQLIYEAFASTVLIALLFITSSMLHKRFISSSPASKALG